MSGGNTTGVLEKSAVTQGKRHIISPDAHQLPTLASQCDCELVVDKDGMAMVIYTKQPAEGIDWAEYDVDLSLLTFVTWSGNVMGLGMKIHTPLKKHMEIAKEIMLVHLDTATNEIVSIYPIEVVIRNIGI